MSFDYERRVEEIARAPRGPKLAAFFDLDRTLMSALGEREPAPAAHEAASADDALLGFLRALARAWESPGFEDALHSSASALAGQRDEDLRAAGRRGYERELRARTHPEVFALVRAHRRQGHRVVLLSSATRHALAPLMAEFGFEHVLCNELETADDRLTGRLAGPPCWRAGKRVAAERDALECEVDLDASWFYTGSHDDLALLERVGHPRPVEPSDALERVAAERGWEVTRFRSRARPGVGDVLRTIGLYGAVVPALALGLAQRILGASRREAAQRTYRSFSSLGLALAGVALDVTGREHLDAERPAIFVANHQSVLDGFIVPHLVGPELTVIGKKEAAALPVIGRVMEAAGFILFDRSSHEAGREACRLAAEDIRRGHSLVIAPEGTRSYTGRLEPFKKGAFHVALETRVPIVPVVIKNATPLLPPGGTFVRPGTVAVEILEPVQTAEWTLDSLDRRVQALRGRFLEALGQED